MNFLSPPAAMRARKAPSIILASGFLLFPTLAHAQSAEDRFWLEGSYYWPSADTTVHVEDRDSDDPVRKINLEDDLGFARTDSMPEFRAGAKLGGGFRLIVEYLAINRGAEAHIERELGFGRFTFEATADVKSSFETDIYRFGLGWDVVSGDHYAAGIVGGLHATNFAITLEGEATVKGESVGAVVEKRDALAPLPTVGAYAIVDVLPQVTLGARVDYIDLTLNNAGGRIVNAEASVLFNVTDNFAIGAGYRHVDYKLEMVKKDWIGGMDYNFDGPKVMMKVALR